VKEVAGRPEAESAHPDRLNPGSLEKDLLAKHGEATPEAMVESALSTSACSRTSAST